MYIKIIKKQLVQNIKLILTLNAYNVNVFYQSIQYYYYIMYYNPFFFFFYIHHISSEQKYLYFALSK